MNALGKRVVVRISMLLTGQSREQLQARGEAVVDHVLHCGHCRAWLRDVAETDAVNPGELTVKFAAQLARQAASCMRGLPQ